MLSLSSCVFSSDVGMFFLFTQQTAYEVRISDWRSDVCSSDLVEVEFRQLVHAVAMGAAVEHVGHEHRVIDRIEPDAAAGQHQVVVFQIRSDERRVGKECVSTCRSRGSQYP